MRELRDSENTYRVTLYFLEKKNEFLSIFHFPIFSQKNEK